uniref:RNase H type-1 domain-containing protein n=1 Tax=Globisporangium ultimum (strain ATCC 200006 / CBS 805.95 / DAOM BR144) TaxID=431595 RepID=K3XCN7_GLOUD
MAYSRQDTTNNIAEYWGLIHGLREAQRMRLYYLNNDYIGLPGNSDLHNCIERVDIRGWYHHYRAFNKMADKAANIAMDTKSSAQCHFPPPEPTLTKSP